MVRGAFLLLLLLPMITASARRAPVKVCIVHNLEPDAPLRLCHERNSDAA